MPAAPASRWRRWRRRAASITPHRTRSLHADINALLCLAQCWMSRSTVQTRPPARTVAAQIRQAIADGEAKPAPPTTHSPLAAVMGVNTNTVLRAVRLLRDEGLLELRQGRGIHITGTPERSVVLDKVAELVQLARQNGITAPT